LPSVQRKHESPPPQETLRSALTRRSGRPTIKRMPKFSAIATAFALLVHSLLGCCCHHVHARPAESNQAAQGCPCQQHRSEPQQDDHLPAEPCEEGHCTL